MGLLFNTETKQVTVSTTDSGGPILLPMPALTERLSAKLIAFVEGETIPTSLSKALIGLRKNVEGLLELNQIEAAKELIEESDFGSLASLKASLLNEPEFEEID